MSMTPEEWAKLDVVAQYSEYAKLADRCRPRNTAEEPPTEEDGDRCDGVMAYSEHKKLWGRHSLDAVARHADIYPRWCRLPE